MSICPVCGEKVESQKVAEEDKVYLIKNCPQHGNFKSLIWKGNLSYDKWNIPGNNTKPFHANTKVDKGCPYDCGLCENHKQQACCVLIELTDKCNQHCPFCFANAKKINDRMHQENDCIENTDPTLEEIKGIYEFLLEQSPDRPFNIQLSGGEPTLREDLPQIISLGRKLGFPYIQINTNGRILAEDSNYVKMLKEAGLSSVFLQFDGTNDEIYLKTRGENLLDIKKKAIANCAKQELGVVLVVTVVPNINVDNLGKIIQYVMDNTPYIRGVHFQPVSYFGRFPKEPDDEDRITIPQLIQGIVEGTNGKISSGDFIPLLTGHAMCSFHGNFVVMEDGSLASISADPKDACCSNKEKAIVNARNFIAKKWSFSKRHNDRIEISPMTRDNNFDEWDLFVNRINNHGFSVTAMAFQDKWNLDLERLQKCRVHIATKDKKLIPFCAYNSLIRKE
ncbi:MAG: radical SAM protein [Eubacteriaceae bacterium]|nr:radical SAM protein [Eubacteriaceae bacterium]